VASIVETVDDLCLNRRLDEWLQAEPVKLIRIRNLKFSRKHKQLIKNIFNHLWLTDYFGEAGG